MAAQSTVQDVIDKFLADNRNIAGSRDGFPALALNLNRCRELAEYIDNQRVELKASIKHLSEMAAINIYDSSDNFNGVAVRLEDLWEILELDL